jgi:hypothetical protein
MFRFNITFSHTPKSSRRKVQGSYVGLPNAPNLEVTLIPPNYGTQLKHSARQAACKASTDERSFSHESSRTEA